MTWAFGRTACDHEKSLDDREIALLTPEFI